jgi:hypothetical protein
MRLCLAPDVFYSEQGNPPPIRLEGAPLRRLFTNYSRFYRGAQAEVDLVLTYQSRDVVAGALRGRMRRLFAKKDRCRGVGGT